MINETFAVVTSMMLAGTFALVLVLLTRVALHHAFGAQVVYASWIIVPLAAMATVLPASERPAAAMVRVSHSIMAIAQAPQASVPIDWRPSLMILWLVGIVVAACVLVAQQRRFVRGLGRLLPIDDGVVRAQSVDGGPALVGAWRPLIVLPADFETRYTQMERELILAHERVHRQRGDARINAIVAITRCLNWFNPLVHYAAASFRFDQELACDVSVISRFPHARRSYADAMLKTQLAGQLRQELQLPVGCRWPSGHPLKERIRMLKKTHPTRGRRAAGVVMVVVFGLGGGYVAWASQAPRGATVEHAGDKTVDADLVVTFEGDAPVHSRMINPVGAPFAVMGDGVDPWRAEFRSRLLAGGNIELAVKILRGTSIVAAPEIVVRQSETGTIEEGRPGEPGFLRLQATLAVHESDWKPGVHDETAPADERHRGDTPAEENTSYRESFPPVYPQSAIDAHTSGHVEIKVLVDEHGAPQSAEVSNANPPEAGAVFGPESVRTVMQWRFHPARKDGKPVSGYILVPIDFSLDG
ncbi:MAG: TonB family protein [Dokdonella sp.]|uniref:TonB family protein n=1 Tax=Dokdonella sp. TaxID=2291710 RepID=UPI003266B5B6